MPLFLDLRRSDDPEPEPDADTTPCWFLEATVLGEGYWLDWHEDLSALIDALVAETNRWLAAGAIPSGTTDDPHPLELREGHHLADFACQWYLRGDLGTYPSIAAAVADTGVRLPATTSDWSTHRRVDPAVNQPS